jgi:dipeptidyl aminopeptidase/acylaminoacyl peptidase
MDSLVSSSSVPAPSDVELIPRSIIFGNPARVTPRLSPDGRYLTYVAPLDGVLNVWIATPGAGDDRPLTRDAGRGITAYFWAYNCSQVVYVQDREGDENHLLYSVDVDSGAVRTLTPELPEDTHPVAARILGGIPERPDEVLVGLNRRSAAEHDVYLLNLRSGSLELVEQSNPAVLSWLTDHALRVRGYNSALPDGGSAVLVRDANGELREVLRLAAEDFMTSGPVDFTPDNHGLYVVSSAGRNSTALLELDLVSGTQTEIASDPEGLYDIGDVMLHPTRHTLEAYAINRERKQWVALDPDVERDFARLGEVHPGDFNVVSRTLDNTRWLVAFIADDGPAAYYEYDRTAGMATLLFHSRPELLGKPLANMRPISYRTRDGLTIHGYLTLPVNWQGPGPLVLNVHGGPWGRDGWGYHPEAQWLANRGYAVLQVNFRGSTGYGKAHLNAGDRQWGRKMQNDLSDAVAWAIEQGITHPGRVVIYGGSYGGYATLAGVTFTPELYAGGVSIVGPSNMETFLNTIPPYWEAFRKQMDDRVGRIPRYVDGERAGQPKDEADWDADERAEVEYLRSISPLFHADKVRVPMLIAQGANDPRVKRAESDQFARALEDKGLQVEYVVYDNEGHGFARPENRLDFYRRAEKFLHEVLSGRYEQ